MNYIKNEVTKIDLNILSERIKDETLKKYFLSEPGEEHYKLLSYISSNVESKNVKIADLGSREGLSALALSVNPFAEVRSYDITLERIIPEIKERENIMFIEKDVLTCVDEIAKSDIILLDIDPHDGIKEELFLQKLIEKNFKGILICDDINLNIGMKTFWYKIKQPKEDYTKLGHWSGTGLVYFK